MILDLISFSCPLLLAATGALFSEYAGILAIFLEGLINFSAFLTFFYTNLTNSLFIGMILGCFTITFITFLLSFLVEKLHANQFIAAIGINLFFNAIISCFSSAFYHTRGVLIAQNFIFEVKSIQIFSPILTTILLILAILFLRFSQQGIYIRITGSSADVLESKGINPSCYRIAAWTISAFFTFFSGCFLTLRISSFVPNIASGKGWMALASVYLGKKKPWKICLFVLIFCTADFISAHIQNYFPNISSSALLSFPYLLVLIISCY